MTELALAPERTRRLPDAASAGVTDARLLPDEDFAAEWSAIFLPNGMKERMLRMAVAGFHLRTAVPFAALPLHGVLLLAGPPGVGKTTLAWGLADKIARVVEGRADWLYIEIDPHALTSSSLGRSQRSVEQLFETLLDEHASAGPMIVLLDEVETLFSDRSALSMEANPIDVHRAVDAALVGLDRLARTHPDVLVIATSNFRDAIDPALASRTDWIFEVPLPDREARRAIVQHTAAAVAAAFPGARVLLEPQVLDRAADLAEGMDGRQLRKAVAAACAVRPESRGHPDQVIADDLFTAIIERNPQL